VAGIKSLNKSSYCNNIIKGENIMSRRIARTRIYNLNKEGQTLPNTAGTGIKGNVGSKTRLRQGEEIVSEFTIDLAATGSAAYAWGTGVSAPDGALGVTIIGLSSAVEPHDGAYFMQINGTASATDGNGIVTSGEMICVETPTGAGTAIGLWGGTQPSGSGADMNLGGLKFIRPVSQSIGRNEVFELDQDLDNQYLYLVHSGNIGGTAGAAYTAGKFVVRLYGYNVFDDV
tara:strand:+ start:461 stop:1150 length:690 start_codon:yes stop_codon:yes gene_type:complete